jgi:malonate-semialdehyde dehydrogenase (acetylating)/methylmalonate-semialdehyde dehydrogenase
MEVIVVTQVKHYINGKQVPGRNGRTSSVYNPATGEQAGLVPMANAAEVADAVAAATKAAPGWAATTPLRRARILNRFLRILEERIDELADVIVAEHGKVHSDAVGEITLSVRPSSSRFRYITRDRRETRRTLRSGMRQLRLKPFEAP